MITHPIWPALNALGAGLVHLAVRFWSGSSRSPLVVGIVEVAAGGRDRGPVVSPVEQELHGRAAVEQRP